MSRTRVAIESPLRGDMERNVAFCRNVCQYAVSRGYNPYAMHLFFPQFLDDNDDEDRRVGIECGLGWTDFAEEVWFCLRPKDAVTEGMRLAAERHQELVREGKERVIKFYRFTQEGELIGEWQLPHAA